MNRRTRLKSRSAADRYLKSLPDAATGNWRTEWAHDARTFCQGSETYYLNERPVLCIDYSAGKAEVYRIDPDPLPLVKTGPGGDFTRDLTPEQV